MKQRLYDILRALIVSVEKVLKDICQLFIETKKINAREVLFI